MLTNSAQARAGDWAIRVKVKKFGVLYPNIHYAAPS